MKAILTFLACILASALFSQSNIQQSLSVNGTGNAADPSAQLDVSAIDKGVLVPRLSTTQRTGIASPATGLLVFDTSTGSFWFYNGTTWVDLSSPKVLADADGNTKVQVEESANEDIIRFDLGGTESMVLQKNTSGSTRLELPNALGNTFVGMNAGNANTTGSSNTVIGLNALRFNTTGGFNTATGADALRANTLGQSNVANGFQALRFNTTGSENVASGYWALYLNTTGAQNTANGVNALASNTSGARNTASGYQAMAANTTGNDNAAYGWQALSSNTTGSANAALGRDALYFNSTGFSNTGLGSQALFWNSTRSNLVAVGDSALYNNGLFTINAYDATGNTALGSKALFSNNTGYYNTATGYQAMAANTTGYYNTVNGFGAMLSNSTGFENTAIGAYALRYNVSGGLNVAVGNEALNSHTTGFCAAVGYRALFSNTVGNQNNALGYASLYSNTEGFNNIGIGYFGGENFTTGDQNIAIGTGAGPTSIAFGTINNSISIGEATANNLSNQVVIGNASSAFIGGFQVWTNYSDARMKKNVRDDVPGLVFIQKLRPVTYHRDVDAANRILGVQPPVEKAETYYDAEHIRYSGFIAQEVEAAAHAAGYDFSGVKPARHEHDLYGISYAELTVPLVKAVQEQQAIIETQATENQALQAKVETLSARLDKITAALAGAGIAVEK